jgi:hypothetical protein
VSLLSDNCPEREYNRIVEMQMLANEGYQSRKTTLSEMAGKVVREGQATATLQAALVRFSNSRSNFFARGDVLRDAYLPRLPMP